MSLNIRDLVQKARGHVASLGLNANKLFAASATNTGVTPWMGSHQRLERAPMSPGLFEFRRRQLAARLRHNQRAGAWAAILLVAGAKGYVVSRFIPAGHPVATVLGVAGVAIAALGVVAFAKSVGAWKPDNKCPACGELFWGSKSREDVGFRTLTSHCMFCGYSLAEDSKEAP